MQMEPKRPPRGFSEPDSAVASGLYWFALSALLVVPSLADVVAGWAGWQVFFLKDSRIQFLWGTLAWLAGGRPFHTGGFHAMRERRASSPLLVSVLVSVLYGYSVFSTFVSGGRLFYGPVAWILAAASLVQLVRARRDAAARQPELKGEGDSHVAHDPDHSGDDLRPLHRERDSRAEAGPGRD